MVDKLRKIVLSIFTLILITFTPVLAGDEAYIKVTEVTAGSETDQLKPVRYLVDEDPETSWGFQPGAVQGWAELTLEESALIDGIKLTGDLAPGATLYLEYHRAGAWIPFIATALPALPEDGLYDLSLDRAVTDKLRLRLEGAGVAGSVLNELAIIGRKATTISSKIQPVSISSSANTSPDYESGYLTDENTYTRWATKPGSNRGEVLFQLKEAYTLSNINLYYTETAKGELKLEAHTADGWRPVETIPQQPAGWYRLDLSAEKITADQIRLKVEGYGELGGLGEVEIWGYGAYQGGNYQSIGTQPPRLVSTPLNLRFDAVSQGQEDYTDLAPGSVQVLYKPTTTVERSSSLQHTVRIVNTGTTVLDLADLKARYWFTDETKGPEIINIYWTSVGQENLTAKIHRLAHSHPEADSYLEIGFTAGAGKLIPGAYVEVQLGINTKNWDLYNQKNDYSFSPQPGEFHENQKYTAYLQGKPAYGAEPLAVQAETAASRLLNAPRPIYPAPSSRAYGSLKVLYKNNTLSETANSLQHDVKLVNVGQDPIDLRKVNLKYWFTKEPTGQQEVHIYWASIGTHQVTARFQEQSVESLLPASARSLADHYLELGFTGGTLAPGAEAEIKLGFNTTNWADYYQANDYTYSSEARDYIEHLPYTAYYEDKLLWGTEPGTEQGVACAHQLLLAFTDQYTEAVNLEVNGQPLTIEPFLTLRGHTLYKLDLPAGILYAGENYLRITPGVHHRRLVNALIAPEEKTGRLRLSAGDLTDGLCLTKTVSASAEIDLFARTLLEEVIVSTREQSPVDLYAWVNEEWRRLYPAEVLANRVIFREHLLTDRLLLESAGQACEVTVFGSAITDQAPTVKINWPTDGGEIDLSGWEHRELTGFIDNPDAEVTINGVPAIQHGHTFRLALHKLDLIPWETQKISALAQDEKGREGRVEIEVTLGKLTDCRIDQPDILVYTDEDTFRISGSVQQPYYQVRVNDQTVPVNREKYQTLVPLQAGFNLIKIEFCNTRTGYTRTHYRRVVRITGELLSLSIDSPYPGTYTNQESVRISGKVEGWGRLTVTVNGEPAVVNNYGFVSAPVLLNEGENVLTVKAEDEYGNTATQTVVVYGDRTAPVLTEISPANDSLVNTNAVLVRGRVTDAGFVYIFVNGKASLQEDGFFQNQLTLADGTHRLEIRAEDSAGNTAVYYINTMVDTTPPEQFEVVANPAGWTNNNRPTLTFGTVDKTSGLSHYALSINDGEYVEVTSPWQLAPQPDGEHTITIKAVDKAGWTTTATTKIYIDTTPPPVPEGFEVIPGIDRVILKWQGEDPQGEIVGYRIKRVPTFPGGEEFELTRESNISDLSRFIDKEVTPGDSYTYTLQARDRAGNYGQATGGLTVTVEAVTKGIDSNGGTVKFDACELIIPKGALEDPSYIRIEEADSVLPDNIYATELGPVYNLTLLDQTGREVETDFKELVTLKIDYIDLELPEEFRPENLGIYWYNRRGGYWEKVEYAANDFINETITVKLEHFSEYQVMASNYHSPSLDSYYNMGISPFQAYFQNNAESVSPATGSLTINATDLQAPGRGGFDIIIQRTYDSSSAEQEKMIEANGEAYRKTPIDTFGCGWSLNIPWIEQTDKGKFIRLPGGQTVKVKLNSDNIFEYHEGIHFIMEGTTSLTLTNGMRYEFDSSGRVIRRIDPGGINEVKYEYNSRQLSRITDSVGHVVEFSYTDVGSQRLISKITMGDRTVRYRYDSSGYLIEVEDPMHRKTSYGYEAHTFRAGVYTSEDDDSYYYNVKLLNSITYPTGEKSTYTYEFRDRYYSEKIENKLFGITVGSVRIRYYGNKALIKKHTIAGKDTIYSYQMNSRIGSFEGEDFIAAHTYMLSCRITEGEKGNLVTFSQIEGSNLVDIPADIEEYKGPLAMESKTSLVNGDEVERVLYQYHVPLRAVIGETYYKGGSYAYQVKREYDVWGNMLSRLDGSRNLQENWTYYKQEELPFKNLVETHITKNYNPLTDTYTEVTTTYTYDETLGKPLSVVISDGSVEKVSRFTYDSYGNLKTKIEEHNDDLETEIFYDETNTFPEKTIIYGVRNADGELEDIVTETGYDWATGLKQWEKDARGFVTRYEYDKLNRVIKVILSDDDEDDSNNPYLEYIFDDAKNICEHYNEKRQKTTYRFDGLGRLTEVVKHTSLYDGEVKTSYHYDVLGRIDRVTDAVGNVTSYVYDGMNRVVKVIYPDDAYVTLEYNDATNTVIVTDEVGGIVIEQKDWAGRLIHVQQYLTYQGVMENIYNWRFTYDSMGNTLQQIDPKLSRTDQEFNAFGQLTLVQLPEVPVVLQGSTFVTNYRPALKYEYNQAGLKTGELSPNENVKGSGAKVRYEYDQLGRVIKTITQATDVFSGELLTMVTKSYYDAAGNRVKVVDPENRVWEYTYSARGWLLSEEDPAGNISRFQYDVLGNKVSSTDSRGKETEGAFTTWYIYDDLNRLTKTILPDNSPEDLSDNPCLEIIYDKLGNQTEIIDPKGVRISYTYTARNWIDTISINGELQKKFVYDAKGNQLEVQDAVGNTTKREYDSLSRLRKVTQLGKYQNSMGYQYDEVGNLVLVEDGRKNTTEYKYNRLGWLTEVKDPLGHVVRYLYDPNGNQVQLITPKNLVFKQRYDELNRVIEEIDSLGNSVKYNYDLNGNRRKTLDRRETTWSYRYYPNNLLQRLELIGADGSEYYVEYQYDPAGNLQKVIDSGNIVKYNYQDGVYQPDPLNRLNSVEQSFDGATYRTEYQYDQAGKLTKIKYPEATEWIYFNYNELGQLSEVQGFTATNGITYNANGSLDSIVFANGVRTGFIYDNHNRVEDYKVTLNGADLLHQQLTYDGNSNITAIVEGPKVKTYEYDANNQLTKVQTPGMFLEEQETVGRFGYKTLDYLGLSSLNFEESSTAAVSLDYASSSIGLDFGTVAPKLKQIVLIPETGTQSHRITSRTLDLYTSENNLTYSIVPKEQWEMVKNNDGVITITLKETLSTRYLKVHVLFDDWDEDFNLTDRGTFLNQLAKMIKVYQEATSRTESYQYDADGNRVNLELKLVQTFNYQSEYYANTNRLKTDGKYAFKYDKAGNMVEKGNKFTIDGEKVTFITTGEDVEYWTYRYDLLNRLIAVTKNGVTVAEYAYDPAGMRVVKRAKGETTHYIYEGTEPIFEKKITSGERKSYIHAFGRYLARVDGIIDGTNEKTYFYHTDYRGSIRAVTDQSGKLVFSADYLAFGKRFGEKADKGFQENHGFTGKEYDPDTGLYYYNARWYDQDLGRFISEDPAADPNNPNLYSYCGNNPIVYTDPTGRWFFLMPIISGVISEVTGGDFVTGFLTGCITGGISLGVDALLNSTLAGVLGGSGSFAYEIVSSGISGGITSAVFGGDFWEGAGQAALAAGISWGIESKFGDFANDTWYDKAIKDGLAKGAQSYLSALVEGKENGELFIEGFKEGAISSATASFREGTENFFFKRLKASNTWYNRALVAGLNKGIITAVVDGGDFEEAFWDGFKSSAASSLEAGINKSFTTNNWYEKAFVAGAAYATTQVVFKGIVAGEKVDMYEDFKFGARRSAFKSLGEGVAKELEWFSKKNIINEAIVDGLKGGITNAHHNFSADKFWDDFQDGFLKSKGIKDWLKEREEKVKDWWDGLWEGSSN